MSSISCLLILNPAFASEEEASATANQQRPAVAATALQVAPLQLEARGPGALFSSIEAAAIDALTYAYLRACSSCDPESMRGGTIHLVGEDHYSYGEIHRAQPWSPHKISYILEPRDVARFHLYPVKRDLEKNRLDERPSRRDLHSVVAVDPLHRPLYILHPSLAVRVYRNAGSHGVQVATLRRRPVRPRLFARECPTGAPSFGGSTGSSRVAETARPAPSY
jgi:hypothetical protein